MFKFKSFRFFTDRNGNLSRKSMSVRIMLQDVVRFPTNDLPPVTSFKSIRTTIFVPGSSNYPGFDFFVWDSKRNKLLAFQVTVTNPFTEHKKLDSSAVLANIEKWKGFCRTDLVELHWIIPKSCWRTSIACHDNVVFFEDIYEDLIAFLPRNILDLGSDTPKNEILTLLA
jgi:hypothetical protein